MADDSLAHDAEELIAVFESKNARRARRRREQEEAYERERQQAWEREAPLRAAREGLLPFLGPEGIDALETYLEVWRDAR